MKNFNASHLAILLALYGNQRCVAEDNSKNTPVFIGPTDLEDYVFKNCGGLIYSGLKSSYIQYKLDTKLTAAEFCVWVFQPESESDTLDFRYHTLPDSSDVWDGVVVYTWSKDGLQEFELPRNKTTLKLRARVVFIALSTHSRKYSDRSSGFDIYVYGKLTFTGANTHFVDKLEGEFSYPVGKAHYDNNEYFALVIQTQKNRSPADILQHKYFELTDVDTEEGVDVVEVYELYPYSYGYIYSKPRKTFKKITSLSGKHDGPVPATASLTPFPYIVLFKSDKKVTGTGFTVRWKTPEWLE